MQGLCKMLQDLDLLKKCIARPCMILECKRVNLHLRGCDCKSGCGTKEKSVVLVIDVAIAKIFLSQQKEEMTLVKRSWSYPAVPS